MRKFSFLLLSALIIVLTTSSSSIANVAYEDIDTIPENCISGVFSISETKKVYFSKGNLQYNTASQKFQFAEHQYDTIGHSGANTGTTGIRDLFGWGTWLEGGNPMNNSVANRKYKWSETKKSAIGSEWKTLTIDEWIYLINRSEKTKIGVAQVIGVQGLVILPDDWTLPNGVSFKSGFAENDAPEYFKTINEYTATDWNKMESAGAVFLPSAGYLFDMGLFRVRFGGYYWSATAYDSEAADFLIFSSRDAKQGGGYLRYFRQSVRLVRFAN